MVIFKCGSCGIEYNIQNQNVVDKVCSTECPNCKAQIPELIYDSTNALLRSFNESASTNWSVSILQDKESKGSIIGTLY